MARYGLLAYCNECGRLDRMEKIVKLADGPTDMQSIGDAYKGEGPAFRLCPESADSVMLNDRNKDYLVPIS